MESTVDCFHKKQFFKDFFNLKLVIDQINASN